MEQRIRIVLGRTAWDGGATAWAEHKIVEISLENNGEDWHVVGEIAKEDFDCDGDFS